MDSRPQAELGFVLRLIDAFGNIQSYVVLFLSTTILVSCLLDVYWPAGYSIMVLSMTPLAIFGLSLLVTTLLDRRHLKLRLLSLLLAAVVFPLGMWIVQVSNRVYFFEHHKDFQALASIGRVVGSTKSVQEAGSPYLSFNSEYDHCVVGPDTLTAEHRNQMTVDIHHAFDTIPGSDGQWDSLPQVVKRLRMDTFETGRGYILIGYRRSFFVEVVERGYLYAPQFSETVSELPRRIEVGDEIGEGWYHYDRYWD